MSDEMRSLVFQLIDQTISPEDFDRLQDAIEQDEDLRLEYLDAINVSESLRDIAADPDATRLPLAANSPTRWPSVFSSRSLAIAATALIAVSGLGFWIGRSTSEQEFVDGGGDRVESRIAGHATLRRSVDVVWPDDGNGFREGDVLSNGGLEFERGVAEIDFFCGAKLIVEGPARLDIESDWSVRVFQGRLRATVPPAARGFVVKAADAEVVDLGTEFAMDVQNGDARVEVMDGEVVLRGGAHDGKHLLTGEGQVLAGVAMDTDLGGLMTAKDLQRRREAAQRERYQQWRDHSAEWRVDPRLIAYYPIAEGHEGREILDVTSTNGTRNGLLVGPVDRTTGRFGPLSTGLEFDRPGARVRTRIEGEFTAFTFACWVRIDDLDQVYNALFMADGYENGEPHWQIRQDGRLMFSVMVDDSQNVEFFNDRDQRVVKDAGLHRVYMTEPFWDVTKSGQWFHLAAVYDPEARRVSQFVNGERVSVESILDRFHVDKLRIGAAEIGNWGQPFRDSPWFAVRNLNGTIDELAVFGEPLAPVAIQRLYERGKPIGY